MHNAAHHRGHGLRQRLPRHRPRDGPHPGPTFHLAHGRTNALYLPHVIRYNGTVPTKPTGWPKHEHYRAPERFQEIAKMLGLPAATPEEGVESYARAVEDLRDKVGIEPPSRRRASTRQLHRRA